MYAARGYELMRLHISSMNDRGSRGGARQGPLLFFALFLSLPPEITPSRFLKGGIARHSANMDKGGGLEFDLQ